MSIEPPQEEQAPLLALLDYVAPQSESSVNEARNEVSMDISNLQAQFKTANEEYQRIWRGFFDVDKKTEELSNIEIEIEARPDFWSNPEISAPILKETPLLNSKSSEHEILPLTETI